jgi:peptide chain release factor 1
MLEKLSAIQDRYIYLEEQLSSPDLAGDMERFKKINKDYKEMTPIVEAYIQYKKVVSDLAEAQLMMAEPDMRDMAQEEILTLEPQKQELEEQIKVLLLPKDPDDTKNVMFEIRSGTGGDEASIFAGDLYRMYQRYFDTQKWKVDVMEITEGSAGGYSKLILEVSGEDVYGKLKFESGAHRVQRVPETESKGRVHTSAATVVVMPKLEMEDLKIVKSDLKIDVFRASGAGGQHVNKTESAVRITHLPTGIVSECQEGRSQHQNREIAEQKLYQRIRDAQIAAADSLEKNKRQSLIGSGDRSDKIRTYNFPQNRMTDHRINLTLYSLDKVMEGYIDEIFKALQVADMAERMRGGEENE